MPKTEAKLKVTAVIAGGGQGLRFGDPNGKQLANVLGRPVIAWAANAMAKASLVDEIVVVCDPARVSQYAESVLAAYGGEKPIAFVAGGDTRQLSVENGVLEAADADIVAIHDGARPLVDPETVDGAIRQLVQTPDVAGVVVGHPAIDTLKFVESGAVVSTPSRETLWVAQTPQVFRRDRLLFAIELAQSEGFTGTDDASIVERAGDVVSVFEGPRENIKVTVPADVVTVESHLASRALAGEQSDEPDSEDEPCA